MNILINIYIANPTFYEFEWYGCFWFHWSWLAFCKKERISWEKFKRILRNFLKLCLLLSSSKKYVKLANKFWEISRKIPKNLKEKFPKKFMGVSWEKLSGFPQNCVFKIWSPKNLTNWWSILDKFWGMFLRNSLEILQN